MNARRHLLQQGAAVAALLTGALGAAPARAAGPLAGRGAFQARTLAAVVQAIEGGATPVDSNEVALSGPDVAENGAVVPFTISATAADVRMLLLLVEKNPNALAAAFTLTPGVEAGIATRVKMGESSSVIAVAVTGDRRVLYTRKDVRVVLGGCGS